jgi:hypothetical protein
MTRNTPAWVHPRPDEAWPQRPTPELLRSAHARDELYLALHPGVTSYHRPATPLELRLTGRDAATWVMVTYAHGRRWSRTFYRVDGRLN